MKKYIPILFAFCVILFSSCGDFQEVTFSGIENVKIIELSQKGAEAEITARIKNPNSVAFTIYKSDIDIAIGGIKAGKAHLARNIRIKSKSEQTYTFRIKSDFSTLNLTDFPKLLSMAMSKNVTVGLKGNLKVGKLFITKSYPFDLSARVPLDRQ